MVLTAADEVEVEDAIEVLPSRWPPLPRPTFARTSRKLQHGDPALPPHPDAIGVASRFGGVAGAQSSAMPGGERRAKRQSVEIDDGGASGSGGECQVQHADRREEYGHYLGPPAEVKAPAAPLRRNPLIH